MALYTGSRFFEDPLHNHRWSRACFAVAVQTDGRGPDVAIECAGFHYAKTFRTATELALGLATDPCDIVNEMIMSVRKVRAACLFCSSLVDGMRHSWQLCMQQSPQLMSGCHV